MSKRKRTRKSSPRRTRRAASRRRGKRRASTMPRTASPRRSKRRRVTRKASPRKSGGNLRATVFGRVLSLIYRDVRGNTRRHVFPAGSRIAYTNDRKFLVIPARTQEFVV